MPENQGRRCLMIDIDDSHKVPLDKYARSVTVSLARLLQGLVLAGFQFSCYETYDENVAAIQIDYTFGIEGPSIFLKRKMTATLIFVDTGIGQLPDESPGLTIVERPDDEKEDNANEWWYVTKFQNTTSIFREYSAVGKIYLRKECYSHLHSLAVVYSVQDIIEALKFFEEEDVAILEKEKVPHKETISILEKRLTAMKE